MSGTAAAEAPQERWPEIGGTVTAADGIGRRRWWTLAVLMLAVFMVGIDTTVLNVALPSLVRELGASASQLQWITTAYSLVFAGLLLTAGSLGDRFGRKGALTLGLVIFGLGSALCAYAPSTIMLIAARGLLGLGAAFVYPATLSVLTNVFPAAERPKAIGIWATASALSMAVGPTLGGWLLGRFWWGSIFLINLPLVVIALLAAWAFVPTSRDPSAPAPDPAGAALSTMGLVALLYAIIEAPTQGWASPATLGAFAGAVLLLAGFVAWEAHSTHPMLNLRYFRNPRFSAAAAAVMLVNFAFLGTLFLLTQFLQFVLGYTPLQAGLRMLPAVIGFMVMSPLAPRLVARFGTKLVVVTGMVIVGGGFAAMATVTAASGYVLAAVALALFGVGAGLVSAPATESILGSLPKAKAGVGSATNDTTIELGGALGVAVLGSVLVGGYAAQMTGVVRGLPAAAAAAARQNLGDALTAARQLGGPAGEGLAAAARAAFIHGLSVTELFGLAVTLAGAVVALAFLPARAKLRPPELPPLCDPALDPSCARPLVGLAFLGRRPQRRQPRPQNEQPGALTRTR
jgi:EmrB/QacA subfamily drug resistance transporter